ncbi:MAG: ABC transporter ATP-binding protein [Acidilobus sp.]
MEAVETSELSRIFKVRGVQIRALDRVSIKVSLGSVVALVGPNGAGKTTLLKILATLITPTSGRAFVMGYDVVRDEREVRRSLGIVLTGERLFYYRLTGYENLVFFGSLYDMSLPEVKGRARELLELVGLSRWADVPYMKYSLGMQRRLALARALLHDPPVLLLDEPTLGLDPVSAREFRSLVKVLSKGKAVLFTSHYMGEVEGLADYIYVIKGGRIIAHGTPHVLKSIVKRVFEVDYRVDNLPRDLMRFVAFVRGDMARLRVPEPAMDLLNGSGNVLGSYEPTLEDVYAYLVGEEGMEMDFRARARWRGFGQWA